MYFHGSPSSRLEPLLALVCAARMRERLSAAVVVSCGWRMSLPEAKEGVPFVNRLFLTLTGRASPLLRLMLKAMAGASMGERGKELAKLKARVPPADYEAFAAPGRVEALHEMMRECVRGGTKGPAWDLRLYMREFDFELGEVRMPVTLFHGGRDANAPVALARKVVAGLSDARLLTYEDESHFSTLCNRLEEIARALAGEGRA